ncbi:response regulator [Lacinutrix neustonica]|uniref:Response regulator n=1 Tax=Lacinutrix neustonica TaxID=2980107 RepID=A0A9E8MWY0_9FLAO|nr:response regulator [Lacinutrix neustonica]WAC02440.1 response regulator [Lacinutrix neustonica]
MIHSLHFLIYLMEHKKVLIVYNDYGISYLFKKILDKPNVTYVTANSFTEVEQILLESSFDLIITDVTIEGAFTNEYLYYLKTKLPGTSIVILSEMNQNDIKKEVKSLGIHDFISLPTTVTDLNNKINCFF